jgi:DNA-directed RNA polymerase specialized sigma24 family protein
MSDAKARADRLVQLAASDIVPDLRAMLRGRYRLLAHLQDDLIQQTLSDLHGYLLAASKPDMSDEDLRAITFSILKRRVADAFRDDARRRALNEALDEPASEPTAPSAERVVRYRRMLQAVLRHVGELDPGDQALLLAEVTPGAEAGAMSPAQRKRLSRLRERIRAALERELGATPSDYLEHGRG